MCDHEDLQPNTLHLRATTPDGFSSTLTMVDDGEQDELMRKLRDLVTRHWRKSSFPLMKEAYWAAATLEILSQDTLQYIEELEGILEGLQADPNTSDELLEKIEHVLR